MITYVKESEIKDILESLKELEIKFWESYRLYKKQDREYIESKYSELVSKISDILDGNQLEFPINLYFEDKENKKDA